MLGGKIRARGGTSHLPSTEKRPPRYAKSRPSGRNFAIKEKTCRAEVKCFGYVSVKKNFWEEESFAESLMQKQFQQTHFKQPEHLPGNALAQSGTERQRFSTWICRKRQTNDRPTDRRRDVFRDFSQPELTAGLQFLDLTADFANFDLREFERGFGWLRSNER